MATQYSQLLQLALPTQGELDGTWGDLVNNSITSLVEEAVAGTATINTWVANGHTLTVANGTTSEARAAILLLTDTTAALTGAGEVVCPSTSKVYIVKNTTGQTITVRASGGTGVAVPNDDVRMVMYDGSDIVEVSTSLASLGITATATELNVLDGITSTTAELNILTGVTADSTELNVLDGITSTTAELNILTGVTADSTELNVLDGITSTTAELNILTGATLSTTELNYVTGVTSAIQTQLDAKVESLADLGVTATDVELNILDGATLSTTELNYVTGVTSAIQTQLDSAQSSISGLSDKLDGTTPVTGIDINTGSIAGSGTEITLKTFAGAPSSGNLAAAEPGLDLTNYRLYSSTDGTDIVEITGAAATFPDGTKSAPAITFASDTNTGFYRVSDGIVAFSSNGYSVIEFGGTLYNYIYKYPNNDVEYVRIRNNLPQMQFSSGSFDYTAFTFSINGATKGSIAVSSTGTSFNENSDYRLKENVTPIENATARLLSLNPVNFNFIVEPSKVVDGFIAHEVQAVVPRAVTGEKDAVDAEGNPEYQGIDQTKLIPLLTAALQEAVKKIETLEHRISALEAM